MARPNAAQQSAKWLSLLAGGIAVAAIGLAIREGISRWTRARIEQTLVRQVASFPDDQAAALVQGLDSLDYQAIPALAVALADPRLSVADAAERAIQRFVADWQLLPSGEAAPRVAILAQQLAAQAGRISPRRRPLLHDLAARLLVWPTEPGSDTAIATIAHCEAILRLPPPTEAELRIAARPAPPPTGEISPSAAPVSPPVPPPLPATLPFTETPLPAPSKYPSPRNPAEPPRLPGASRETPQEPRQFLAPRAEKLPSP